MIDVATSRRLAISELETEFLRFFGEWEGVAAKMAGVNEHLNDSVINRIRDDAMAILREIKEKI